MAGQGLSNLNFLQGVLHDDLADKLKECITGKGKLTADDFDEVLPTLTSRLEPDVDSMSDILSANDLKIIRLLLAQGHLSNLKRIGFDMDSLSIGEITKEKFAEALKQVGQDQLAQVLRDKQGIRKLQSEIYRTVYVKALRDPRSFTVDLQVLRMVLCGVPRSGKTTFWRRLVKDDFNTEGISQSTPLAEQHHIQVSNVKLEMAMLYDWHLCGDDDTTESQNEIGKEALVIYKRILDSYNNSPTLPRDAGSMPITSADLAPDAKHSDSKDTSIVQEKSRMTSNDPNSSVIKPVGLVASSSNGGKIYRDIDRIFKKLQESLTSIDEVPDTSSLRQLINLNDIGGQRAFLELLPILSTGSALYLVFFSYGSPLNAPLKDQYQGPERTFYLANEYTQVQVIMQSLRCVATSSFSDQVSTHKDEAEVSALLIGTHTDSRSDQPGIDNVSHYIQREVKGFLDSETNVLEYANVVETQLVLEVNNKTKSSDEFKQYKETLKRIMENKFSKM